MSVQRHRTAGRSCDAGSYPYVYIGSTEVQHSNDNRISEREECNTDTQRNPWGEARVYKQEFLDKRVLREYRRLERATDTEIHTESGKT